MLAAAAQNRTFPLDEPARRASFTRAGPSAGTRARSSETQQVLAAGDRRRSPDPAARTRAAATHVDDRRKALPDPGAAPRQLHHSPTLVRHVLALDDSPGPARPTNGRAPGLLSEEPCEGCLFTGRLQPGPMDERGIRMPEAAMCVYRSVPLLQRRSAAHALGGACGPGARLRLDTPTRGRNARRPNRTARHERTAMKYAGIGSRETTPRILAEMERLA